MMDNGEGDNFLEELEFDLKHLRDTRPDLAPENLDADALVDVDRELATNEYQPLSVNEMVNKYLS